MKFLQYYFFIFLFNFPLCLCIEPISSSIISVVGGIAISAGYAGWQYAKCSYNECCDDKWIKLDYSGLLEKFKDVLYGQHLVEKLVIRALKGHITNKQPAKALVMSFHGSTGIGKNFVSGFIAESLYTKGRNSEFVHWYSSTISFPHKSRVEEYRDKLQKEVREATQKCQRSLFIFDEIDKMPAGVIDAIKPYMDYYDELEGVDYRKNIFIFLSNAGGNEISRVTLKFWSEGKRRTDITLKDMQRHINKHAFNEAGGLQNTEIIKRSLIDLYIPFLPLERTHVEQCIETAYEAKFHKKISATQLNLLIDQIEFTPHQVEVFAESGCKRIDQKIDIYCD